ncbi:5-formyltetrahydrofolate cyclo-ligase [Kytococcus sedentarius]|uniref:5-formyltetrahydrofolate cyclo-ligase n=1 Tax=Kytococcus sedentarius TaxID=1276 RepID=UPI000A3FEF93|nr:5-formyltetrahydrofolate cyclo-ligase [Kytococcus sedentarius]
MTTKTTLRAEARRRRRGRRRDADPPPSGPSGSAPIPVRNLAEARGIAGRVLAFASSLGGITLPAMFVSTPLEPDLSLTLPLFPRVLLPVLVDEAGAGLAEPSWGIWEGGSLAHPPGMPAQPATAPLPAQAIGDADLIVVPALAVSLDGTRLGQGGGWYDRALPHRAPSAPVAAVVFDDEVLAPGSIPREVHDVRVDAIITPTRVIGIARS